MTDNNLSKKISIKVKSVITDLTDDKNDKETVEYSAEGSLNVKGGTIELVYRETEAMGLANVETTLRFKQSRPTLINLVRRGDSGSSMIFDTEIPLRSCTYRLGSLPFSFFINTNSIVNDFSLTKGKIVLDYDIEIHGEKTEHTVFTLEYKA